MKESPHTFLGGCIAAYNRDISNAALARLLKEYKTIEGIETDIELRISRGGDVLLDKVGLGLQ